MAGVVKTEKVPVKGSKKSAAAAASSTGLPVGSASTTTPAEDPECDSCRANVYLSWIRTDQDAIFCLQHGLKQINSGRLVAKQCRLVFTFSIEEVEQLIGKLRGRTTGSPPAAALKPTITACFDRASVSDQTTTTSADQAKIKKPTKSSNKRKF